jgi:hypothetical protein
MPDDKKRHARGADQQQAGKSDESLNPASRWLEELESALLGRTIEPGSDLPEHLLPRLPDLVDCMLNDLQAERRRMAAWILGRVAWVAPERLTPAFLAALDDRAARHWAVSGLGRTGTSSQQVLDLLVRLADDPGWELESQNVVWALEALGRSAVPGLIALAGQAKFDECRWNALGALERLLKRQLIEPERFPSIVEICTAALDSFDWRVRSSAAMALGELGECAVPALGPLLTALADEDDPYMRVVMARACWRIGRRQEAIDTLVDTLDEATEETLELAITTLSEIGPPARSATQALRELAARLDVDEETSLGEAIATALDRILATGAERDQRF